MGPLLSKPAARAATAAVCVLLASACEADLEEACVSGPCDPSATGATASAGSGASGGSASGGSASGGSGGSGGTPACQNDVAEGDYPCEVHAVLQAKCFTCHTDPPQNGAPIPLLTYERTQAAHKADPALEVHHVMAAYVRSGYMPFGDAPDLTEQERATLEQWFAACAPPAESEGCEGP